MAFPDTEQEARKSHRVLSIGALAAGVALVLFVLFGGDGNHSYRLLFHNAGQIVSGNEVLVAGQPMGSVEEVALTDDAQAEVMISVDEPLHAGTTATIRATSLSGIANRYVSIAPGLESEDELPDGATITAERTTTPVDLDQLFSTFGSRTREALRDVIRGQATVYSGNAAKANRAYRYLAPGLQAARRLLAELTRDERSFSELLVNGSRVLGAAALRRDDLAALTENANRALGAIAEENAAFDRALVALPPALRQANTTFVNLRAALDDLDPLVATSKPATRELAPFLRELRAVAEPAVPVVRDLRLTFARGGEANDLTDALRLLPRARERARSAVPRALTALDESQPVIEFARPYTPDLLAFLTKFGQATAYYDASGHYARVQPAGVNLFSYDSVTGLLDPIPPSEQLDAFDFGLFTRCPGGATQPAEDGSSPFLDDGGLAGACNPTHVPPGP